MSPRTGRPKAKKPKTIEVKARLDEEMNKRLVDYCKENNTNKTDVVRKGIVLICNKSQNFKERSTRMYSFETVNGDNISFENLNELGLEKQTDIATDKVTAYLISCNDRIYEVTEETYNAIESKI